MEKSMQRITGKFVEEAAEYVVDRDGRLFPEEIQHLKDLKDWIDKVIAVDEAVKNLYVWKAVVESKK